MTGAGGWRDALRERLRPGMLVQLAVWLSSVGLCTALLVGQTGGAPVVGVARGRIVQLGVAWDSLVEAVPVKLFQSVRRGEVVALLDDSVLEAQIVQVEAEIARLRAEHEEAQKLLEAEFDEREAGWDADGRSFARDASELAIRLREVQVDLEYDCALRDGLRAQAGSLTRLVERGHAPAVELELARAEAVATERRCEESERLAAELAQRLADAETLRDRHRLHEPARPARDAAVEQLSQAIAVQRGLLQELEAMRAQCILRSPFDGTIVAIARRAGDAALARPGEGEIRQRGEAVRPGDAVVAVAADVASEIVAWVVEGSAHTPQPGARVELITTGPSPRVTRSSIESVGATVERLPERLWVHQVPVWGRPFVVPVPAGFDVAAGDRVEVRLR
ncbi:MAG TPA: hypothetical protein VD788_10880 [Candidatus Polarisedimenticolaceae bacterium]|nr:hypothetical protein [Candidatus Polarisedimenticolaceae bacterium]